MSIASTYELQQKVCSLKEDLLLINLGSLLNYVAISPSAGEGASHLFHC